MFFEAAGEAVMPVAIADEIEKSRVFGVQSRFQRASPRIADRPWRQPRESVRVIGRVHRQVGVMKASLVRPRQQLRVNYAWVGIERHVLRQPVVVHAGYERPLLRSRSLFFYDRSHGHDPWYFGR